MSLDKSHVVQSKTHLCYTICGKKGSGKSVLLERMCEVFYHLGRVILDLNGSPDLEQLHWCVPNTDKPKDKQIAYPILLIIPRTTEVLTDGRKITVQDRTEVEAVKVVFDDTSLKDIIMMAHRERRIVVFNIYLYDTPSRGQKKLSDMIFALPNVMRDHIPKTVSLVMALRELADVSSSRMKTHAGTGETASKRSLTFLSRQIRHLRVSLIVDTQNIQDLYAAFVSNLDILIVKNINLMSLPPTLSWFVNDIQRKVRFARDHYMMDRLSVVSPDRLSTNSFYAIYPDQEYKIFHNSEPSFRHHGENDSATDLAGIKIRYLSRTEVENVTSEDKILQIKEKSAAKEDRLRKLNDAYQLYSTEKAKAPTTTWTDIAKKVQFLGLDGKPSGNSLRMAVEREAEKGNIDSYSKG